MYMSAYTLYWIDGDGTLQTVTLYDDDRRAEIISFVFWKEYVCGRPCWLAPSVLSML